MTNAETATRTVTLVTGDRVTVAHDGGFTIQRGSGRQAVRFLTGRLDGHLNVIPSDALAALAAGQLDRRLFDVTLLLEYGYDQREDQPLMVTQRPGTASADARALASSGGAQVVRDLPAINGFAVRAAKDTAFWAALNAGNAGKTGNAGGLTANSGITVWLDGQRRLLLEQSVPQIGAPIAWQAGYDGTGVKVAVLDSGIDVDHPDVARQIEAYENFSVEDDRDVNGHGTHVASTIVSTGAASGGRNKGVAPGARLLVAKVCIATAVCTDSMIIAAMQWAAEQGAVAANMSFGGQDTPGDDPIEQAIETLTAQYGTLFVVAAGNSGPGAATVGSPASATSALSVGAVNKSNELADFSSRGPRIGDGGLKPDITAPGVDITAARSSDSPGSGDYLTASGTSMAAPHMVGATAILAQRHPDWSAAQLKAGLMGSALPREGVDVYAQGTGRVDVARAVSQQIIAEPASVDFGRHDWPHADDAPATRTVTYHNHGTTDVTLGLTASAVGPDGNPTPAGMFALSADTLTVPAGGQAAVTLTADTRVAAPDGFARGRLVATASGTVVQTTFAVNKEIESYDVTVTNTSRDQQAPEHFYDVVLVPTGQPVPDQPAFYLNFGSEPTQTIRAPRGSYTLFVRQVDFSEDPAVRPQFSFLAQPSLQLTSAQNVAADGRLARPITITLPRPGVSQALADITATVTTASGVFSAGISDLTFEGIHSAALGSTQRPVDGFSSQVGGTWAHAEHNSPEVYHLAWLTPGRMVTGANHRVRDRDLATVTAAHAAQDPEASAWKVTFALPPGVFTFGSAALLTFDLPFTRTEYYNTDGGVRWMSLFTEETPAAISQTLQQPAEYRGARSYREDWNRAVFGPALGKPTDPLLILGRTGDTIHAFVPLFGDGTGRSGLAAAESARMTLSRNGVKIGEVADYFADFTVPAQAADYRLEVTAQRTAGSALSTGVSAVWTFRSAHVDGTTPQALPLSSITFSPAVDSTNTAPAGRAFTIPVTVAAQPDSRAGTPRRLTAEVSYDDGATWRAAPVETSHGKQVIRVNHPTGAGFVSLRASATDSRGNTVTETIIRAYRIG